MVIEPLLLNSVFHCDVFQMYKLLEETPKDTYDFGPALGKVWLVTQGHISKMDELNIGRATL